MELEDLFGSPRKKQATPATLDLHLRQVADDSEEGFKAYIGEVKSAVEAGQAVQARSAIHTEIRMVDEGQGILDYIASDETLDSYREAIRAAGWQFNRFKKNAPFVDSHDYSTIGNQVGKVTNYSVQGRQLVERVQWAIAPELGNELAQFGFRMTVGGFLKAVSVGFLPVRMVTKWDGDEGAWQQAVQALQLTATDAAVVRAVYLQQEQFELSSCIIGANGNAVAKAFKADCLKAEEVERLTDLGEKRISRCFVNPQTGSASLPPAEAVAKGQERADFVRELSGAVASLRSLTNRS